VYRLTTNPTDPPTPLTPSTPLLLIDDILTTGTTMRALISTIRRDYPVCPIRAFTLTRADYTQRVAPLTGGGKISHPESLK
jgi:predicted amidophosphoribosyltransferase